MRRDLARRADARRQRAKLERCDARVLRARAPAELRAERDLRHLHGPAVQRDHAVRDSLHGLRRRHIAHTGEWCPMCRKPLKADELTAIALGGIGKMRASARSSRRCRASPDPVRPVEVDGARRARLPAQRRAGQGAASTATRRSAPRRSPTSRGGVLLLCLEDSFAGLHLPHARHVVFAAIVGDQARVERPNARQWPAAPDRGSRARCASTRTWWPTARRRACTVRLGRERSGALFS